MQSADEMLRIQLNFFFAFLLLSVAKSAIIEQIIGLVCTQREKPRFRIKNETGEGVDRDYERYSGILSTGSQNEVV